MKNIFFTAAHCFWIDGIPQNIRRDNNKYIIAAGKYERKLPETKNINTQTSTVCV